VEGGAAGVVLGVLSADGTRRIVASGNPGPGAHSLGPESVFEIGSITKAFTGILLADMAARGEVDLTAPVQTCACRHRLWEWCSRSM
jgi:D-alanyl-D-alanine-carboxypeptidase/D-alanyl-D-alanine-endopeptidase